jgi:chromosome segregation ATPase
MEASSGTEPRVIRLADAADAIELDTNDLLGRLEAQAEENGRLRARVESSQGVARSERESRRRLSETIKRERKAAEALHARAEHAESELAARAQEVERLERALAASEQHKQVLWAQLAETERELVLRSRSLWRRVLRRPAAG